MRKLGRVTILTLLIIILSTLLFVACDKDGAKEKQVPVYKGMTISRSFAKASAMSASDDNGNHYGHFKGDHNNRNDEVDQNKPFEDPNAPSIENKANSTLDIVGAAESIYYADKNQDIFITIKLSNPDSYEILSFTLNGKKYSNYMFEDGSDMENLVLKVNVGDVGGIVEYTIDAIKYVDGTDIKDVRMDGDRTVKAGVRADDQTYVNVTNEQKTMTSISFDAQVVDLYSLIEKSGGYAKAVLYDGANMLTKDIKVGEKTNIVFDNLTPNTVYQYGVVALYDNLSGNGAKLNTLYKKAVYTDTIVLFKDVQVGKESIEWGFVWNESFASKQMSEISLWQNGAKVQDVDATAMRLDGLKSNNEYTLKATYKNLQNQDETISIEFVTYAKAVPTAEITNAQSTQTQVSFELNVTDTDNVGAIAKIELLHGDDDPIVSENAACSFENLLSNNDYTIQVTYVYDLNDGVGEQQIVKTANIKTKAKAAPSVEIGNWTNTQNKLSADVTYMDVDVVGRIENVVLFKGETQVATTNERTHVVFDALEGDTEYTLVVIYKYNLNDGKGEQTTTQSAKRYTSPVFEFVEATCANTSAVSKGDVIYFEAIINNPSGVTVEQIKINDQYYTPSAGTTKNSIIVNIEVEDQFEGGDTDLTVSEIKGTLRGQEISISVAENNMTSVFVNGELFVKSICIVDEDGKECDMVVSNKTYFYKVELVNKTGYIVESVTIQDSRVPEPTTYNRVDEKIIQTENNYVLVLFDPWIDSPATVTVKKIKYGNSYLGEKSKDISDVSSEMFVVVENEDPIVISTAEDLKNMEKNRYYVLGNDIDLAGIEWKDPTDFLGYFDGQGHTVKNMKFVGSVDDADFYWGLFRYASGTVKNLKLEGRLIATMNSSNSAMYKAEVGGLCAEARGLTIDSVENNVNMSITNNNGAVYAGGLVGKCEYSLALIVTNSSNIGVIVSDHFSGGFIGYSNYCNIFISNSYNAGSITGNESAGGFIGYNGMNGHVSISNSCNLGSIVSDNQAGGIAGSNCYGTISISNSYNTGSVIAEISASLLAIGNYDTVRIMNSYYTEGESSYGEKKTLAEIIEIMKTKWDQNIWDFDNLDENGNPTLK